MNALVPWIQMAGGIHLAMIAANFALPRKLQVREHLPRLTPILRQVFLIHWLYILLVLLIFSALCLFFAPELACGSALGRFLSGAMCLFWLLRIVLQLGYYDAEVRRQNRLLDTAYLAALCYFAAIFALAASGAVR
jgi:hypothetical protein